MVSDEVTEPEEELPEVSSDAEGRVSWISSVDEIGDPKKSSGHYEVSIRHF